MASSLSPGTVAFCVVAILCALPSPVQGRNGTPSAPSAPAATSGCTEPREGIWRVEHLIPNPETGALVTAGWSVLSLRKEFDGVYSGNGAGVSLTAAVGAVENRGTLSYSVLAIFELETCTLAGALYNLAGPKFADPIVWKYDGTRFTGSCVSAQEGELVFEAKCGHRVSFVE